MDKIDFHTELVEDIWRLVFNNQYLGIQRMKKILAFILNDLSIPSPVNKDISVKYLYDYKRYHHNEWLRTSNFILCKSSYGRFILTIIDSNADDHKHETDHHYDLNLHEAWDTNNYDVFLHYEQFYKEAYIRKLEIHIMDTAQNRSVAKKHFAE